MSDIFKMPEFKMPEFKMPEFKMPEYSITPTMQKALNEVNDLRQAGLASGHCKFILQAFADFESSLDADHEVALKLASFGQTIILNVTHIGYRDPSIIRFIGFLDNGSKAELIQNINQLNFLMIAVQKPQPDVPARRIGFSQDNE